MAPAGWLVSLALAALLGLAGCSSTAAAGDHDGGGAGDAGQVTGTDGGTSDGGVTDGGSPDGGASDGGLACSPGDPPAACGVTGSTCTQSCLADGTLGPCQPASGPIDTKTDADNCGQCGNACPQMIHAPPACHAGVCGRGPCIPGWYDLNGTGCVWQCDGQSCTSTTGQRVPVNTNPLPESGLVFEGAVSSSSWGAAVETSANYTNIGALGEPTPPGAGSSTRQTSASYVNIGGLDAIDPP